MTTPSFSENLVKLPRFSVSELIALMRQIEEESAPALTSWQMKGHVVSEHLSKSLARITQARKNLEDAQIHLLPDDIATLQRKTDRKMDDAWKAFESFLRAYTLLDDGNRPSSIEAQHVYDFVIGDGMAFLTYPFELEWQETKKRLDLLESQQLAPMVRSFGGERFLLHLKKTFVEYGEALSLRAPDVQEAKAIRSLWDEAHRAVRQFFAKVAALEDPDIAESHALVSHLLKPVLDWQKRSEKKDEALKVTEEIAYLQTTPLKPFSKE